MLDHLDVLYKNVGKEQIDSYLMDNFFRAIDGVLNAATRTSGETLKQVQEELARVDITSEEVLWYAIELNQACLANDLDQLISIASVCPFTTVTEAPRSIAAFARANPIFPVE